MSPATRRRPSAWTGSARNLRIPLSLGYEEQRQPFLGQAQFTTQERQYSEETAREIDCAVRELTEQARQKALHILQTFRKELEAGAVSLLETETLLEDELPKPDLTQLESAETLSGS